MRNTLSIEASFLKIHYHEDLPVRFKAEEDALLDREVLDLDLSTKLFDEPDALILDLAKCLVLM